MKAPQMPRVLAQRKTKEQSTTRKGHQQWF